MQDRHTFLMYHNSMKALSTSTTPQMTDMHTWMCKTNNHSQTIRTTSVTSGSVRKHGQAQTPFFWRRANWDSHHAFGCTPPSTTLTLPPATLNGGAHCSSQVVQQQIHQHVDARHWRRNRVSRMERNVPAQETRETAEHLTDTAPAEQAEQAETTAHSAAAEATAEATAEAGPIMMPCRKRPYDARIQHYVSHLFEHGERLSWRALRKHGWDGSPDSNTRGKSKKAFYTACLNSSQRKSSQRKQETPEDEPNRPDPFSSDEELTVSNNRTMTRP